MTSPSESAPMVSAGEWISCGACVNGTVSVYSAADFEGPGDCPHCNAGQLWRYPSGALALYPGGPFAGRNTAAIVSDQTREGMNG